MISHRVRVYILLCVWVCVCMCMCEYILLYYYASVFACSTWVRVARARTVRNRRGRHVLTRTYSDGGASCVESTWRLADNWPRGDTHATVRGYTPYVTYIYVYVYVNVCVARSFRVCTWTAGMYRILLYDTCTCAFTFGARLYAGPPRRACVTGAARCQWRRTARDAPPSTATHPWPGINGQRSFGVLRPSSLIAPLPQCIIIIIAVITATVSTYNNNITH